MDQSEGNQLSVLLHVARYLKTEKIRRISKIHGLSNCEKRPGNCHLLCMTIKFQKSDLMDLLLSHDCLISIKKSYTDSPLHQAIWKSEDALVEKLVLKGADLNNQDSQGRISLHLTAKFGRKFIMRLLLNANASGSGSDVIRANPNVSDSDGRLQLHWAVHGRHYAIAGLLLESNSDVSAKYKNDVTLIFIAAEKGDGAIFGLLLKFKAEVYFDIKKEGKNILFHAVNNGCFLMVEYILNKCINTKEICREFFKKNSLIVLNAISKGYTVIIKLFLLHGLDVSLRVDDTNNSTLLHCAVKYKRKDIAAMLLAHGANINSTDAAGNYPIYYAIKNISDYSKRNARFKNELGLIDLLLQEGAGADYINKGGLTSFYHPIENDVIEVVSLLLAYDANPDCKYKGDQGAIALHYAADSIRHDIILLLLNSGSDVSIVDNNGVTVFQYAWKEELDDVDIDTSSIREIYQILQSHIVRLKLADICPNRNFLKKFRPYFEPEYTENCKKEVVQMKTDYFPGSLISFYDFLISSSNELMLKVGNDVFSTIMNSSNWCARYPNYEAIIRYKVTKANRRKKLIDEFEPILCDIFSFFPRVCIHTILKFLTSQEIRRLICLSKLNFKIRT